MATRIRITQDDESDDDSPERKFICEICSVATFRTLSRKSVISRAFYPFCQKFCWPDGQLSNKNIDFHVISNYTLEKLQLNCMTQIFTVILFLLPKFTAQNSRYLGQEVT